LAPRTINIRGSTKEEKNIKTRMFRILVRENEERANEILARKKIETEGKELMKDT
jgi:hypothetical protein